LVGVVDSWWFFAFGMCSVACLMGGSCFSHLFRDRAARAAELIELGFEYVNEIDHVYLYRKRK
jgi:cbb3-type cytochrome oxidase subunit 3